MANCSETHVPPFQVNSITMGSHLCPAVIVTFSAGRGTEDTLEAVKIFVSDS